jgi:hypothetical protein
MKRKHLYLIACLALVGALALTSQAFGDRGGSGNGSSEAVHHSNGNHRSAHKRHHRRHRHRHNARHAQAKAGQTKLEGNVTAVDNAAKTITLALDDSSTDSNGTAVVNVPDTSKFATGDKVELFVTGPAADGSFTLVSVDNRGDDANDDGVNHDANDDGGNDHHGGGDNSGPGRGGDDD